MADRPTYGPLDPDTEELLEKMMNYAQRFIDLQVDDDCYHELQSELDELGSRFNIEKSEIAVTTEEEKNEQGDTIIKISFKAEDGKTIVKTTREQVRNQLKLIVNEEDDEPTKH